VGGAVGEGTTKGLEWLSEEGRNEEAAIEGMPHSQVVSTLLVGTLLAPVAVAQLSGKMTLWYRALTATQLPHLKMSDHVLADVVAHEQGMATSRGDPTRHVVDLGDLTASVHSNLDG
jgi:hypothetical protein